MSNGLLHYNARQFITLINIRWDVNSWVRVTDEIHEHLSPTNNDDSSVYPWKHMVYNIHECNIIKCIIYVHLLLKLKPLLAAVYRSVSRDSMKEGRQNTETRSRMSSSSSMGGKQEVKSPSGNIKTSSDFLSYNCQTL